MRRCLRTQSDFRKTLQRNLLSSLLLYETIVTTEAKAKALVSFANKFLNRIKSTDLSAKKLAHATLLDSNAVKKVFEEILPRYAESETTFVRSLRYGYRRGDGSLMSVVSLTKQLKVTAEALKSETTKTEDEPVTATTKVRKKAAKKD